MRCDGCGFEYDALSEAEAVTHIAAAGERYGTALRKYPDDVLRQRPEPATWAPIEYACHVRDVLLVQRDRVLRALVEDEPTVRPMHRDERVELDRYAEQDPVRVADQLAVAAELLAGTLGRLDDAGWARLALYNFPEPQLRSIRWVARHTVHEIEHHLLDVIRPLS